MQHMIRCGRRFGGLFSRALATAPGRWPEKSEVPRNLRHGSGVQVHPAVLPGTRFCVACST
eukprot:6589608-Alexandrium_andersonii.AAC.1